MFHNEMYSHAILTTSGDHDISVLHCGLYELMKGLRKNKMKEE